MCLSVAVELVGLDRDAVTSLVATLGSADLLRIEVSPKRWFGSKTPYLLPSEDGGCACSLLSDDADWNAPAWAMEAHLRPKLAATLTAIGQAITCPMVLEALWAGDSPSETVDLDLEVLSDLAARSQLGTKTRYRVAAHT
jgi:hypothetical protein